MERVLLLTLAAVTWPLWLPFLRAVIAEIRAAAESDPPPAARARRARPRLVNRAWNDALFRSSGGARTGRSGGPRRFVR